jgi:curli production assembly/transport component CsgG
VLLLSSCAGLNTNNTLNHRDDVFQIGKIQNQDLINIQTPNKKPVVAVYGNSFLDQTGQRKSNSSFALFSTSVTQAPSALLIRALKHAGNGEFFTVVERVGLDNLTKERQLIRSAREQLIEDAQPLRPLLMAGVLLEGAVLSYDTNIRTGGAGFRTYGLGSTDQFREDVVTVSLRMVSVSTGEILIEILSQKTIFSWGDSQDVFRFIEQGTQLVEIEFGYTENESATIALQKAIEGAVLELIKEGYERGFWKNE